MSYPPPPGGPPPPLPQGYSGPYGPPPQQPPWPPQQWPGPPPKKRGNGWKWALGAVALLVVIGVTAVVTISVTSGGDEGDPTPSGETYGLASADDTGPVNIITEDPSCAAWTPINDTFGAALKKGWSKRDPSIPATDWTPELRAQYEEVGQALNDATKQAARIAVKTPHRVMRELYEQFIAYGTAFSEKISAYRPADNHLALAAITTTNVLVYVCSAIAYGSAEARAPLVDAPPAPSELSPLAAPSNIPRLLTAPDSTCTEWDRILNKFDTDTKAWQAIDPNLPASAWTADQRGVIDAVIPVMMNFAENFERLGEETSNPTLRDFAVFAAQYRRAHAEALPTYEPADNYLDLTAWRTTSVIYEACKAVGA